MIKNGTTTKKNKAIFLEEFDIATSIEFACTKADIGRSTYYRWLREDQDFKYKIDDRLEQEMSIASHVIKASTISIIEELKAICLGKKAKPGQVQAINSFLDRAGIITKKVEFEENSINAFISAIVDDRDLNNIIDADENPTEGLGIYAPPKDFIPNF